MPARRTIPAAPVRRLLFAIDPAQRPEDVIDGAIAVCRYFRTQLELLHAHISPREMMAESAHGIPETAMRPVLEAAERHVAQQADAVRSAVARVCRRRRIAFVDSGAAAPSGCAVIWHEEEGLRSTSVALRGRLADLILAAQPSEQSMPSASLDAALRETGRAVIVLPRPSAAFDPSVAVIAWNGSREAARAVTAALPLLHRANAVHVVATGRYMRDFPSAQDLVAYLARHEIDARARRIDASDDAAAGAILTAADGLGAGLIVMGAYSRTRLSEVILGGVTRRVLLRSPVPVLMAH